MALSRSAETAGCFAHAASDSNPAITTTDMQDFVDQRIAMFLMLAGKHEDNVQSSLIA
jgi:hypothetical protein